jgi:cellulose synthase/poly-beta-1,6-N-acetylglucosamine synthase-like glycosyltransferase
MASDVREQAAFRRRTDLFVSIVPSLNFTSQNRPIEETTSGGASTCPELDCLRDELAADLLAEAERRALAIGVGAERVLIAAGAVSEEDYLRRLADALDLTFDSLDGVPRAHCPIDDERLIESAAAGMLPLKVGGELYLVVAPRGLAVRRIMAVVEERPELARRIRFTTSERLTAFVFRHGGQTLAARAADGLRATWPLLSAAPPRWRANIVPMAIVGLVAMTALMLAPAQTALASEILLSVVFLAWVGLRLTGAVMALRRADPPLRLRDDELPVYTVIAALYREATSVHGLITAIERLEYPPEKLDVKFVVEAEDAETRAAIERCASRIPIEVLVAPASGPRTKPKALNVALPFVRGSFTVIYDAEDRPEAGQLRRALQAFVGAGEELACVQACLAIDNTSDGWLARLFTAEYAGQFDVFLPGIAALRLPLPLGGSSNHLRTATLRELGGWDAYNVTEDADLGMRLARFGYRTAIIDSTTYEEAPAQFLPWLRQRTRWFKGWMQTWLVHMREPRRLLRNLGFPGFQAFQLIVGGNVLAALVHPLFLAGLAYGVLIGAPMWTHGGATVAVLVALYGSTVVIGYAASAFLAWVGLARRGLLSTAWVLLLTPVHWLLLSLAAWRALAQLVVSPYRWEKTEHGLARSSRRAQRLTHVLLQLERLLRGLKEQGDLPALPAEPTYISAARPRTPRAAA